MSKTCGICDSSIYIMTKNPRIFQIVTKMSSGLKSAVELWGPDTWYAKLMSSLLLFYVQNMFWAIFLIAIPILFRTEMRKSKTMKKSYNKYFEWYHKHFEHILFGANLNPSWPLLEESIEKHLKENQCSCIHACKCFKLFHLIHVECTFINTQICHFTFRPLATSFIIFKCSKWNISQQLKMTKIKIDIFYRVQHSKWWLAQLCDVFCIN